jgi:TPR repeat protein
MARLPRIALSFAFTFLLAAAPPVAAKPAALPPQQGRLALVIGVSDYGGEADLRTPLNDVALVGSALRRVGFGDLTPVSNPDLSRLNQALNAFIDRVRDSRSRGITTTAILYFAGHGIVVGERAYLLPARFAIAGALTPEMMKNSSIDLQDLSERLQSTGAQRVLIVIDACRDNPWVTGRPHVPVTFQSENPDQDALLVLSAGDGGTAIDSLGGAPDSPYAQYFSATIVDDRYSSTADALEATRALVAHATNDLPYRQVGAKFGSFEVNLVNSEVELAARKRKRDAEFSALIAHGLATSDVLAAPAAVAMSEPVRAPTRHKDWAPTISGDPCAIPDRGFDPESYLAQYLQLYGEQRLEDKAAAGAGCEAYLLSVAYTDPDRLDREGAITFATKAYKAGIQQAVTLLTYIYRGTGDWPADSDQLRHWVEIGRNLHIGGAINTYGVCLRDGCGTIQADIPEAIRQLKFAASLGSAFAATNLAVTYGEAKYHHLDATEVDHWYREAIRLGSYDAPQDYALVLFYGNDDFPQIEPQPEQAILIATQAAAAHNAKAANFLADIYTADNGINQRYLDLKKAFQYRLSAAEAGLPDAMWQVGLLFRNGTGTTIDIDAAIAWMEKAAKFDEPDAYSALASIYLKLGRLEAALKYADRVIAYRQGPDAATIWPATYFHAAHTIEQIAAMNGAPLVDAAYLSWLKRNYGASDNWKNLSVPIRCGSTELHMIVTVYDWNGQFSPARDQFTWLKEQRACTISPELQNSFEKLYSISQENKVSFVDLVMYDLGKSPKNDDKVARDKK